MTYIEPKTQAERDAQWRDAVAAENEEAERLAAEADSEAPEPADVRHRRECLEFAQSI